MDSFCICKPSNVLGIWCPHYCHSRRDIMSINISLLRTPLGNGHSINISLLRTPLGNGHPFSEEFVQSFMHARRAFSSPCTLVCVMTTLPTSMGTRLAMAQLPDHQYSWSFLASGFSIALIGALMEYKKKIQDIFIAP